MTCSICGNDDAFAAIRVEIPGNSATYHVCPTPACATLTAQRIADNVLRSGQHRYPWRHPLPDATAKPTLTLIRPS